jgi:uncharacterized membrane protein
MGAVFVIALLWIAFGGTHVGLSGPNVRPRLVGRLGEQVYKGFYSLVAFATLVPLVWTFSTHKHAGPSLWATLGPPLAVEVLSYVIMGLALVLFACSLVPGSSPPSSTLASGPATVRGIVRVTRHPTFAAFALFGLAHLLANGNLGDVIFFGGFPVFAWIGARHQDERKARERPGYRELIATTSILPFAAIAAGKQRLAARELPLAGLAAGLVLTVVLSAFHGVLFGP